MGGLVLEVGLVIDEFALTIVEPGDTTLVVEHRVAIETGERRQVVLGSAVFDGVVDDSQQLGGFVAADERVDSASFHAGLGSGRAGDLVLAVDADDLDLPGESLELGDSRVDGRLGLLVPLLRVGERPP